MWMRVIPVGGALGDDRAAGTRRGREAEGDDAIRLSDARAVRPVCAHFAPALRRWVEAVSPEAAVSCLSGRSARSSEAWPLSRSDACTFSRSGLSRWWSLPAGGGVCPGIGRARARDGSGWCLPRTCRKTRTQAACTWCWVADRGRNHDGR